VFVFSYDNDNNDDDDNDGYDAFSQPLPETLKRAGSSIGNQVNHRRSAIEFECYNKRAKTKPRRQYKRPGDPHIQPKLESRLEETIHETEQC